MNKRLRKKKHKGEFKEIGFDFKICFKPIEITSEEYCNLLDEIFETIEKYKFIDGGRCDNQSYNGYMTVLNYKIDAETMKEKLLNALKELPSITDVTFGENTDAWYGPFKDL